MSYAGLLNTTCTIQVCTYTQDSVTFEMDESWATHASSVACRLTGAQGGRIDRQDDIYSKVTHKLFLAYRTDLNWKDYRIVIGSNTYKIINIINAGGAGHHTELDLQEVR